MHQGCGTVCGSQRISLWPLLCDRKGGRSGRPSTWGRHRPRGGAYGRVGAEIPMPRAMPDKRAFAWNASPDVLSGPVFYTLRKRPLLPKARDVTYRQCKSLRILTDCSSVWFAPSSSLHAVFQCVSVAECQTWVVV